MAIRVGDKFKENQIYHEIVEDKFQIITINSYYNDGSVQISGWTTNIQLLQDAIRDSNIVKINYFPWEFATCDRVGNVVKLEGRINSIIESSEPKEKHKCKCSNYDLFNHGCKCGGI